VPVVLDLFFDAYLVKMSAPRAIIRPFRLLCVCVFNLALLAVVFPSRNAKLSICLYITRGIMFNYSGFMRLLALGEEFFRSYVFVIAWCLSLFGYLIICLSAFSGSYNDILYWLWISVSVLLQLLMLLLSAQWYIKVSNIPLKELSVPRLNCSMFTYLLTASIGIYSLSVILSGGAYSVVPITTMNYVGAFHLLTNSFLERNSSLSQIIMREVWQQMF
jgi:hypothetical protein